MDLFDNLLNTSSYQYFFYLLIPFLLLIILAKLQHETNYQEDFEASRNNSTSSNFLKTLEFDRKQQEQLQKSINKLDDKRAKEFILEYDNAGKINLQLEELHNEINLLKSKLKICTDKKKVKVPKVKVISLCANPINESRSTMSDSNDSSSNVDSIETFVPSLSLPSTKPQSRDFLLGNKSNAPKKKLVPIPVPTPKKDIMTESSTEKKDTTKDTTKDKKDKTKDKKDKVKDKKDKVEEKKDKVKDKKDKVEEKKDKVKEKKDKVKEKKDTDIDSTKSVELVVPDVKVNIKPIQTKYVVGCESDKDCNLFYGDGKNTCKSNHQCRCEVGSGKLCQRGPTNYKDTKDMTEKEKTIFKNLSNYDNFTIQDYKNWLDLYKRDYYLLSDEHLINLRKSLRGEPITLRDIPTGGLRPPLTSQKYFAEMYDKLGDLEQIVSPINSSTTGAQVGYNYNEYSDFAPPNAIPQLRVVNGEIERKYRRPSAKNKIFPVPLEDAIGPYQSNPAM